MRLFPLKIYLHSIKTTISTVTSRPSFLQFRAVLCVLKLAATSAVISHYVTNKSFLVCVKDEKYAFLVTLRAFWSMRQVKVEIYESEYWEGKDELCMIKLTSEFHHLPRVCPK